MGTNHQRTPDVANRMYFPYGILLGKTKVPLASVVAFWMIKESAILFRLLMQFCIILLISSQLKSICLYIPIFIRYRSNSSCSSLHRLDTSVIFGEHSSLSSLSFWIRVSSYFNSVASILERTTVLNSCSPVTGR